MAELKAMLEWDNAEPGSGREVEQCQPEGRVARDMRRNQIVADLILLRRTCDAQQAGDGQPVRNCAVVEFFGDKACGVLASAETGPRGLDGREPAVPDAGGMARDAARKL